MPIIYLSKWELLEALYHVGESFWQMGLLLQSNEAKC
jgi:hypothetical protein